jgi:hypothetical protein
MLWNSNHSLIFSVVLLKNWIIIIVGKTKELFGFQNSTSWSEMCRKVNSSRFENNWPWFSSNSFWVIVYSVLGPNSYTILKNLLGSSSFVVWWQQLGHMSMSFKKHIDTFFLTIRENVKCQHFYMSQLCVSQQTHIKTSKVISYVMS